MPACSAFGCVNRSGTNGITVHRFPSDEQRRKQWAAKVNRCDARGKLWIPSKASGAVLCEEHFDQDQYEPRREDKRLKWNAVPTIFQHRRKQKNRKPPLKRALAEMSQESPPAKQRRIHHDHAYVSDPKDNNSDVKAASQTADDTECPDDDEFDGNIEYPTDDSTDQCPESDTILVLDMDHQGVCPSASGCIECTLKSAEVIRLQIQLNQLEKRIKKLLLHKNLAHTRLCRSKKRFLQQTEHLSRLFNDDQMRHLQGQMFNGMEWQDETIKEGLQLWFACGAAGYNMLLQKGYPLPSVRTLQRRLRRVNLEIGLQAVPLDPAETSAENPMQDAVEKVMEDAVEKVMEDAVENPVENAMGNVDSITGL